MPEIVPQQLLDRLARLEAEQAVRRTISEYMHLCDALDSPQTVAGIAALFSEDALWEGVGEPYAERLGRHQGREAIAAMMAGYVRQPAHFTTNVHFLCSEQIQVDQDARRARGRWKMLQTSTFHSGASHLNCAELLIHFRRCADDEWRICHFTTRNLFSRPVDYWHADRAFPVPHSLPPSLSGENDGNDTRKEY